MDYLHILSRIQVIAKFFAHHGESITLVMMCILPELVIITFVQHRKHLTKRQAGITSAQDYKMPAVNNFHDADSSVTNATA